MQIPFGQTAPTEQEAELLTTLGFDMNAMKHQGNYYFLEMPKTPRIRCERHNPAFDRIEHTVFYNNIPVISINQKTAFYDAWVYFSLNESNIKEALSQNENFVEEKKPELTDFQQQLTDRIQQLEFIVLEDGAERGYGKMIGSQLPSLQELRSENPEEHDQLIDSNPRYKKLLHMFPNWTDRNNLQPQYEARDVGPFAAMSANSEDGTPPCNIM